VAIDRSGLSASELARRAEIDPAQVHRFLHGLRDIRMETAGLLCRVLGLELAEVARGRGRPKSQRVGSPEGA
jgi:transcriptional regulator with XRE-family HTH domain